jgi:hypothetical protein
MLKTDQIGPAVFSARWGAFHLSPARNLKKVRMFGTYPAREILMWIGGMLVAAAIAIFGVTCLVDAYLAVHDPADALSIQRDFKSGQDGERE